LEHCLHNTPGNFELLSDALDEIIRLMLLAEEIHFKFDEVTKMTMMVMIQFMFIDLPSQ
jgi:hypothetical protein